jgi:hypothetical protein
VRRAEQAQAGVRLATQPLDQGLIREVWKDIEIDIILGEYPGILA